MKQTRQTYVERELRRRRIERNQRVFQKIVNAVSAVTLVAVSEAIIFALAVM